MYRKYNKIRTTNGEPAYIQWDHVDGPLLHTNNGQLYWLSIWDRLKLKLKLTTIQKLSNKIDCRRYARH